MIDVLMYIMLAISLTATSRVMWAMSRRPRPDWRIPVLEALLSGPKLSADLPLPRGNRYVKLARLQDAGMVDHDSGHTRHDGRYIYRIAREGIRLLGEQER